jgi:hypothetical protein
MKYHIKYQSYITGSKHQTTQEFEFDEAIAFVRDANEFYKRQVSHCLVEATKEVSHDS